DPNLARFYLASDSLFTCGTQVSRPNYLAYAGLFTLQVNYTAGTHLNCTAPIPSGSIRGLQNASCLGCNGQDPNNICYYAPGFVNYRTICETYQVITPGWPFNFNASAVRDLRGFLQRGYEVRYFKPAECRRCEISGGRCGSQPISRTFLCFCPSSVHRMNCSDDASIFSLPSNYSAGTFLNCTAPIPSGSIRGLQNASCLGCNGQDPNNVCYYAPGFVSYPTICETFQGVTPGGPLNATSVRDLRGFLQSGFEERYVKSTECLGCELSGGRCGSRPTSGSSVCFCPSSVHPMNCSDDTNRVLSLNYNDPTTAILLIASDSLFTCGAQVSRPNFRADATIFSLPSNYTPGTHLNCTAPIPSDSIRGLQNASCLGCKGQDPTNVCYYAPGFVSYPTTCENYNVFTPGGAFNASGVRDLRAFLQSGYQIRYAKPAECSGCEISGGRCGSQPISGSFVCFCTSTVHRMNCSD
ncbi:hypothetical protein FRX31_004245, partial [Thalictrum thalictroides]